MTILFVAPSFPGRVKEYLVLPSLEMCIMSNILKSEGYNVELFDMKIEGLSCGELRNHLSVEKNKYDYILIDDSPEVHCNTKVIIRRMREYYPNSRIIIRGEIVTAIPVQIMERNPYLDYAIIGDDDYAIKNIIKEELKEESDFASIPNICFRDKEGNIIETEKTRRQYKLDDLPMPDRELYDIDKYLQRDSETIVRSSRGCPGNCLFCIKTRFEEFGLFSIPRFADEIEALMGYGFESFFFSDDTFAFSDERVEEFAQEIEKRNLKIRFTSNIRIRDINEYKISRLKEAGAYRVFVGIETVNSQTSTVLRKNISKEIIQEKLDILKKYNIEFHASFILGAPNDTSDDLEETIRFVKEIKPTIVTFNLIKVYPGLPFYNNPEKYGIILDDPFWFEKDEWSKMCIMGTERLPPSELEKWSRRMLFEFIRND